VRREGGRLEDWADALQSTWKPTHAVRNALPNANNIHESRLHLLCDHEIDEKHQQEVTLARAIGTVHSLLITGIIMGRYAMPEHIRPECHWYHKEEEPTPHLALGELVHTLGIVHRLP
jgi:hypothetical protein